MMSLPQLRDRLSLTQVSIACLSVLLGDGMRWWSFALVMAFAAWAFVRPLPPELSAKAQRAWTIGIFAALVATGARALLLGEIVDAGVDFVLLLVVQRLFNRQRSREHSQLLLLGLLLMVVGAVINTGLNYPILLAAYLVFALMTMILNHLLAEGERLGPRITADVLREGGKRRKTLWRATFQTALLAAAGALIVFLVFPRWGVGVFLRGSMARESRSGFSGEVELGGFGRIKSDPTVVARMVPLNWDKRPKRLTWHLRGSAFDVYEKGKWSHAKTGKVGAFRTLGGFDTLAPTGAPMIRLTPGQRLLGRGGARDYSATPIPGFAASEQTLHVLVTLEDIGVDALFLASEPLAAKIIARGGLERRIRIRAGRNREFKVDKPAGPVQYEFLSRLGEPTPRELQATGNPSTDDRIQTYTVRSQSLSPQVSALAEQLTEGKVTRFDKAAAIMEHLAGFAYTLDQPTSARVEEGADPLEGFLFDTQAGHCEYFATAMAMLLREVGVPARIVNGYYGAHYNDLGEFYAVRQADAHSWVEVHFGDLGWVTFDPTPPAGRVAGDDAGLWPAASKVFDALRNAYLDYIIDYNLTKQIQILEGMGVRRHDGVRPRVAWKPVLAWFFGFIGLGLLVRYFRRRGRPSARPDAVVYDRLLKKLAAAGYRRRSDESPTRFAARLRREHPGLGQAMFRFAARYEATRFAPPGQSPNVGELRALSRDVRQALRDG